MGAIEDLHTNGDPGMEEAMAELVTQLDQLQTIPGEPIQLGIFLPLHLSFLIFSAPLRLLILLFVRTCVIGINKLPFNHIIN